MISPRQFPAPLLNVAALFVLLCIAVPFAWAQDNEDNAINVSPAANARYTYSNFRYHILPANTAAGKTARAAGRLGTAVPNLQTQAAIATVPSPGFYPDDLDYFGGPVVTNLLSHPLYINASSCGGVASCWGNPERFLTDLGFSTFIHVTDQYTKTSGRYVLGQHVFASMRMFTNTVGQSELLGAVHDAAAALGTPSGHGNEFHIFLPKGVDTCFDQTSTCYSPDNPPSFFFCAYHGSVTFSDIGHVLFSVEPYQNVNGCQAGPPNPNGILADSTNSVLSHELIETITDPDGNAWIANNSLIASGAEIGDLCERGVPSGKPFFDDPILFLNGRKYQLQLEYSNRFHACSPR
jgi:hypothetical protein